MIAVGVAEEILGQIEGWIFRNYRKGYFYKNNSNHYAPSKYLAECLGITKREFSRKMSGEHTLTKREMDILYSNLDSDLISHFSH